MVNAPGLRVPNGYCKLCVATRTDAERSSIILDHRSRLFEFCSKQVIGEGIPKPSGLEWIMRFSCQPGCTRCCTQKGWVYLSVEDVPRLAAFLGMGADELQRRYVYATKHTLRLRKPRQGYCPFLKAEGCSVHPAKPTQCRVFPFWPELIEDRKELEETARWCPGIGKGAVVPAETLEEGAREMRKAYPRQY